MNTKQFNAKTLTVAKKINLINQLGGCCSNCGETRHWMLEFHHEGDKEFNIWDKRDGRISVLNTEIEKCVCVCSNCHRKIHHVEKETVYKNIKIKMLEYKNTKCCQECGYCELNSALEFHHIDPTIKEFNLSSYRGSGQHIPDKFKKELDKCIVLCSNCHKTKHYDFEFFEQNKQLILTKLKNIKEPQRALDKNEVKRLYDSGMKAVDIAKQFNTVKSTISGILKSFGLTKLMDDIKIDREEFYKLVTSGYSRKQLREHFNINKTTVINILQELKITIPKLDKEDPENGNLKNRKCSLTDLEFIEACKTKGGSQISREFNVSPAAISIRKKRLGLR